MNKPKPRQDIYFGTRRLADVAALAAATGRTVTEVTCAAVDALLEAHADTQRQISTQIATLLRLLGQTAPADDQIAATLDQLGMLLRDRTLADAIAEGIRRGFEVRHD